MTQEYRRTLEEAVTEAVISIEIKYEGAALDHLQQIYFEVLRRIQKEME